MPSAILLAAGPLLLAPLLAAQRTLAPMNTELGVTNLSVHNLDHALHQASFSVPAAMLTCNATEAQFQGTADDAATRHFPCDRPGWAFTLRERAAKATDYTLGLYRTSLDEFIGIYNTTNVTLSCEKSGAGSDQNLVCRQPKNLPFINMTLSPGGGPQYIN